MLLKLKKMKVKLINVADYEIKDGKATDIPFNSFMNLCGGVIDDELKEEKLPKVRLFKAMSEFILLSKSDREEIDQTKDVKLLSNGQFLVFLKDKPKTAESKSDATADTKKN